MIQVCFSAFCSILAVINMNHIDQIKHLKNTKQITSKTQNKIDYIINKYYSMARCTDSLGCGQDGVKVIPIACLRD